MIRDSLSSQLSSLMDRNEGNNACLLHPKRCKQETSVSKNRTEFCTTAAASQYKEW
ncbi:conserved hypothetical protein [Trichinella spiralis]|uniref:hypothetical protein n=1 Tax=Trichinella spiralis TaxID=6334 RepID=UPI0001EFE5EB|nr:conserved hypothetical protein [Trichinella spiralis]